MSWKDALLKMDAACFESVFRNKLNEIGPYPGIPQRDGKTPVRPRKFADFLATRSKASKSPETIIDIELQTNPQKEALKTFYENNKEEALKIVDDLLIELVPSRHTERADFKGYDYKPRPFKL